MSDLPKSIKAQKWRTDLLTFQKTIPISTQCLYPGLEFGSDLEQGQLLVKGNFKHSYINIMGCRLCSRNHEETQEHLQQCEGKAFERWGIDLSNWWGVLDFWRRMTKRMEKLSAVPKGTLTWSVVWWKIHSVYFLSNLQYYRQ